MQVTHAQPSPQASAAAAHRGVHRNVQGARRRRACARRASCLALRAPRALSRGTSRSRACAPPPRLAPRARALLPRAAVLCWRRAAPRKRRPAGRRTGAVRLSPKTGGTAPAGSRVQRVQADARAGVRCPHVRLRGARRRWSYRRMQPRWKLQSACQAASAFERHGCEQATTIRVQGAQNAMPWTPNTPTPPIRRSARVRPALVTRRAARNARPPNLLPRQSAP
jgi:hypothetical protein